MTNRRNSLKHGVEFGTNGGVPLRRAQGHRLGRTGPGLPLPLQGVPAPHGDRIPFRHLLAESQVRTEGEHKVYPRIADSGFTIRFPLLPDLRKQRLLGRRQDPGILWDCGRLLRQFPPPTASIWEESMHGWLGLPSAYDHFVHGFPPSPPTRGT
jgi:hypothetical protein